MSQSALNIGVQGNLVYPSPLSANDVWGYATTTKEYALVGLRTGVSIVDVTNPQTPTEELFIPGVTSTWRDLKTWSHYAYVTHDLPSSNNTFPVEGLLIIDLDSLQNPRIKRIRFEINDAKIGTDTLDRAHNIYIDENGIAYLFGSNVGVGGALMFDLATDPWNPAYIGMFNDFYLHDGMVRGDTLWGGAIYTGNFLAIDVSNKMQPSIIGNHQTPNSFTHNCWISDDGKTVYTTDELPDSYVAAYDVSDMQNITELDRIQRIPGNDIIPHNVHVYGNFLVTSYYTSGVQIVDAEYPNNLIEVGFYDTYTNNNGNTYDGNWGAYPYLPSGNLLVTDRTYGLFVLNASYTRASRVSGLVKDSLTQQNLFNVEMIWSKTKDTLVTDLSGQYIYGIPGSGWDTLTINHPGYFPKKVAVNFVNGVNKLEDITLIPLNISVKENLNFETKVYPNPAQANQYFKMAFKETFFGQDAKIEVFKLDGQVVWSSNCTLTNYVKLKSPQKAGMYLVKLTLNNGNTNVQKLRVE